MIQICVLLLISTLGRSVQCSRNLSVSNLPRDLTFRTSLHVARSLNPESTEDLSVKTKSGDVATIIVKKRERGRNMRNIWGQDDINWKPITSNRAEFVRNQKSFSSASSDTPRSTNISTSSSSDAIVHVNFETENSKINSQENITSDFKLTGNLDHKDNEVKSTSATVPIESSVQKLESSLVFGVIPSSPYQVDKFTRSVEPCAREYPLEKSPGKLSDTSFVPILPQFQERTLGVVSAVSLDREGNTEMEGNRQSRKLHVDPDGVPVITGIRVPDDESDRQVWRNARVINGILVPYSKNHNSKYPQKVSHSTVQPTSTQWLNTKQAQKKPMNTIIKYNGPSEKWSNEKIPTTNPLPPNIMLIGNQDDRWYELGVASNTNNVRGQEQALNSKFRPSLMSIRDDVRQSQDNNYVSDKILDYIKQINEPKSSSHRSVRKVEDPDDLAFLESDNNYFTSSTKTPPRVSFEGVRTPVLLYAHPEFGVQPAKVVSTTISQKEPEVEPILDSRAQALAYFAHDIHADRSPFAFEPGLEEEARVQESFDSKTVKSLTQPKKIHTYSSPKYVDSKMPYALHNKYEYASKYPFSYKGYYTRVHEPEKPIWRKISDTVKDHVQNGFEKVSNFTRPVVEPIMKATNKISQNLGLSSANRDIMKKNVDLAGGSSILLPSLVAGGAALGLGAVALGRYLHMDITHMRSSDDQQRNLHGNVTLEYNTEVLGDIATLTEANENDKVISNDNNHTNETRSSDNAVKSDSSTNTPTNDFISSNEQKKFPILKQ